MLHARYRHCRCRRHRATFFRNNISSVYFVWSSDERHSSTGKFYLVVPFTTPSTIEVSTRIISRFRRFLVRLFAGCARLLLISSSYLRVFAAPVFDSLHRPLLLLFFFFLYRFMSTCLFCSRVCSNRLFFFPIFVSKSRVAEIIRVE